MFLFPVQKCSYFVHIKKIFHSLKALNIPALNIPALNIPALNIPVLNIPVIKLC